jgi:hypothetical protein
MGMMRGRKAAGQINRLFTEDWLAVVVGLVLVGLTLAGILRQIP